MITLDKAQKAIEAISQQHAPASPPTIQYVWRFEDGTQQPGPMQPAPFGEWVGLQVVMFEWEQDAVT